MLRLRMNHNNDDDECVECSSIVYTQSSQYCDAKLGTFALMEMFSKYEVDVVFGPVCSSSKLYGIHVLIDDTIRYDATKVEKNTDKQMCTDFKNYSVQCLSLIHI